MTANNLIKGKIYKLPGHIAYEYWGSHKGSGPSWASSDPLDPWSCENYQKSESGKYEALCRYATIKNDAAEMRWLNTKNPSGIFLGELLELCEKGIPWTSSIVIHRPLKELPPGGWGNYRIPVFLHETDPIFPFSFSTRTVPEVEDSSQWPNTKRVYVQNVGPLPQYKDFIGATTMMKHELEKTCQ